MGKITFGSTGHSYQPSPPKLQVGGAPTCPRCTKRVYFNEEKRALGKVWHTTCFTCAKCSKRLDSTTCAGHEDEIYCSPCHKRHFGPRGYGFAGGAAGLSTESNIRKVRDVQPVQTTTVAAHIPESQIGDITDPECCPRCGKKVFFAEEMKAHTRKWHKLCFRCGTCDKMLEKGRCSERQGEIYCATCYGRQFGPSGYGFAGGAGCLLSSDPSLLGAKKSRGGSRGNSPLTTTGSLRLGSPAQLSEETVPAVALNGTLYYPESPCDKTFPPPPPPEEENFPPPPPPEEEPRRMDEAAHLEARLPASRTVTKPPPLQAGIETYEFIEEAPLPSPKLPIFHHKTNSNCSERSISPTLPEGGPRLRPMYSGVSACDSSIRSMSPRDEVMRASRPTYSSFSGMPPADAEVISYRKPDARTGSPRGSPQANRRFYNGSQSSMSPRDNAMPSRPFEAVPPPPTATYSTRSISPKDETPRDYDGSYQPYTGTFSDRSVSPRDEGYASRDHYSRESPQMTHSSYTGSHSDRSLSPRDDIPSPRAPYPMTQVPYMAYSERPRSPREEVFAMRPVYSPTGPQNARPTSDLLMEQQSRGTIVPDYARAPAPFESYQDSQQYRGMNTSPIHHRANPAPVNEYAPPDLSALSMHDVTSVRDPNVERAYTPESLRDVSSPRYTPEQQKQASNAIFRALDRHLQTTNGEGDRASPLLDRAQPAPVNDDGYNTIQPRGGQWTDPVYL